MTITDYNPLLDDEDEGYTPEVVVSAPPTSSAQPAEGSRRFTGISLGAPTPVAAEHEEEAAESFNPLLGDDDDEPDLAAARQQEREGGETSPAPRQRASRFRLTVQDRQVLDFLNVARYAPHSQLAILLGVSSNASKNRANRLVQFGYLARRAEPGYPSLYFLTKLGKSEVDGRISRTREDFGRHLIAHTLAVNGVIVRLMRGEFPTVTMPLAADALLTEAELQRYVYSEQTAAGARLNDVESLLQLRDEKRKRLLKFRQGESKKAPELAFDGEWLWCLFDTPAGQQKHFPDLVMMFPRSSEGQPNAYAFEIELTKKDPKDMKRVLECFKREMEAPHGGVYGKVIYLVKSEPIRHRVIEAAMAIGFPQKRLVVELLENRY